MLRQQASGERVGAVVHERVGNQDKYADRTQAVQRSKKRSVALLSYRGNPHSGGQGVYVAHLARGLAALGVNVEVFTGPPYPDLVQGSPDLRHAGSAGSITITRVPSLDLYREPDPFRRPRLREFRSAVDVLEYAIMCAAGFPEPLTFTLRVARIFAGRRAAGEALPDIVHDNQSLGYGLLWMQRLGLPVIATVHHPINIDRKLDLGAAPSLWRRMMLRRWYGFVRMQRRVITRIPRIISVSSVSADDIEKAFDLPPGRVHSVPIGVDPDVFAPLDGTERVPGRLIAVLSADVPLKGVLPLLEALAKVRVEHDADLVIVGRSSHLTQSASDRLGISHAVRFESAVSRQRLVQLFAEAEIAIVPSLYEGFSLPAVEAMACGVPLVATTGGALPEVVGDDGAGLLVPPGDPDALAQAILRLCGDAQLRARMGRRGRERALARFTWRQAARRTNDHYRAMLEDTC